MAIRSEMLQRLRYRLNSKSRRCTWPASFSWIVYKSRAQRDRVNAKVMRDPRIAKMMDVMAFDVKRMTYGGFRMIVDA
jgi:uncharacterized protein YbaA (DUF1428 family)